jgi:hypothetical protein
MDESDPHRRNAVVATLRTVTAPLMNATADHIAAMRTRFENWRDQLMAGPP